MFVDPIIMQFPENLDSENFVIATYYCATKPTTNMVKFAAALAIEQTCGTWLKVPGETPEVRERAALSASTKRPPIRSASRPT